MIPALIVALVLQASPLACTAEEVAAYEVRGWDAYECDGDKAAYGDTDPGKFDGDTCAETDEGCPTE